MRSICCKSKILHPTNWYIAKFMNTNAFTMGAHSYNPKFYFNTKDFLLGNKALLNNFKGAHIHSLMVVWSVEHKEAWLEAPVVLITDIGQIELCAFKLTELSITKDTINLNIAPSWFGDDQFEWRQFIEYPRDEFIIESIEIIEIMHSVGDTCYYDLNGIQLKGGKQYLSICNGLDCNVIHTCKSDQPQKRVIQI